MLERFAEESATLVRATYGEAHLPEEATLAVDFTGTSDALRNTLFGARRVKDGIVDRLRALRGTRPGVDLQAP